MKLSLLRAVAIAAALVLGLPGTAAAHAITERYEAPLPLIAYVGGAALAVALSFAFVMLRARSAPLTAATIGGDGRATAETARPGEKRVPGWLRLLLGAVGLVGWSWIIAQGLFGGADATADVGYLFLWVYGWVGVALLSAFLGPVWYWIDPFSTIHRLLSAAGSRLGLTGSETVHKQYPERLSIWPAVVGFAVVVWLELVAFVTGGRMLAMLLLAYTLFTLAGMSWFGRSHWRAKGEVFGVWFGVLGRLAPFELVGEPEEGRVVRRPFAAGLVRAEWTLPAIVLVTLGTGAIIYDGLSQTQLYFDIFGRTSLFGLPDVALQTMVMLGFLGAVLALVLAVAGLIGRQAIGAGLLPVAVGYLVAHYVVALLVEGQLIVRAINDPLLRGDDLLPYPLPDYQPTLFLPVSLVWSLQLAAVVGGHVLGAWAGHAAIERRAPARPLHELPLAALMVAFTSVTLWSLGQEVIAEEAHRRPPTAAYQAPVPSTAIAAPAAADGRR